MKSDNQQEEDSTYAKKQLGNSDRGECKLLGLGWSKESDTLCIVFPEEETMKTKRGILAKLAKIYDPLGLVFPLSLKTTLIYPATCDGKGAWDAALSDDLMQQWTHWENNLPAQVKVPRSLAVHREPIGIKGIKACLHGRFLLRLKVLFSPFGRCEGVDESQNVASYEMS